MLQCVARITRRVSMSNKRGAFLGFAGKQIRAAEARQNALHLRCDGARKVEEFALEPLVDARLLACGRMLERAYEVFGQTYREFAQREQRRKHRGSFRAECLDDGSERPPTEGEIGNLPPSEA